MSAAVTAITAENLVLLAAIGAGWRLLRQGGGLQMKTPPVPKRTPQVPADTEQAPPVREFGRAS